MTNFYMFTGDFYTTPGRDLAAEPLSNDDACPGVMRTAPGQALQRVDSSTRTHRHGLRGSEHVHLSCPELFPQL